MAEKLLSLQLSSKVFRIVCVVLLIEFLEFLFRAGFATVPKENNANFMEFLPSVYKYFAIIGAISIVNAYKTKENFAQFIRTAIIIAVCVLMSISALETGFPALAKLVKSYFDIDIYGGQWISMALIISFQFAIFLTTEQIWNFLYPSLSLSYDKEAFKRELDIAKNADENSEADLASFNSKNFSEYDYESNVYIKRSKYIKMAKNPLKPIF